MNPCIALIVAAVILVAGGTAVAQQKELGQKPGQPLGLPADQYKEHPSDLAPDSDPQWKQYQQQRQQRIERGEQVEDPFYAPPTVIREETTRYEVVDEKKKSKKPAARWSD